MNSVSTQDAATPLPAEMHAALARKIESGEIELPVLPEVASQVITASMDEACDIRKLSTILNRDQSMAAHVLRLCNSAMYAASVPIVSLQQALSRLGLKRIREIALLISCETKVFKVAGFDLRVRALFRHSLAAAAFAQEIARARRWNVEEAFLCGLLHDIGRPVLLQTLVDLRKEMDLDVEKEAIEEASREFHCRVGKDLAARWNLSDRLIETIEYHHDPEAAPTVSRTAMMTRLADDLAHFALGKDRVAEEEIREHPMNVPLNMYPDELEGLIQRRDEIVEMIDKMT
ncbi:MAG: HDOD domain-containing protein [Planctomycetota bacterium JB042]